MRNPHESTKFMPFRLTVPTGTAEEITVGVVERPARVDWLTLDPSTGSLFVRAWALPDRAALREGLGLNEVVGAELLTSIRTDTTPVQDRTGLTGVAAVVRTLAVGRVVAWAPWYLVVRVENATGVLVEISGQFALTLFETLALWDEMLTGWRSDPAGPVARWRQEVRVGVGSAQLGAV